MGKSLPGSPIVGLFDERTQDFGGHDRALIEKGNDLTVADLTRPYGFVPTDGKVWFQKFNDEGVEHEYLCTECYIWTGIYPESKRIITEGNNQSMELNDNYTGSWTEYNDQRVFIFNDVLVEKLCILGENVEPCFEGAQFSNFSLKKLYSMLETLVKGGLPTMENFENKNPDKENEEEEKKNSPTQKDDGEEKEPKKEKEEDKKEKKSYNLADIVEYNDLKKEFSELQEQYNTAKQELETAQAQVKELVDFKKEADRKAKQTMIDGFYMLSDEDKKDVQDNIDSYSLDDIEAKLSIICVRNKVNFNLDDKEKKDDSTPQTMFNLRGFVDDAPDWIKAVRETANK